MPNRALTALAVRTGGAVYLLDCGEGADLRCNGAQRVESNDDYTLPIEPYEVASLDYPEPNGETTTLGG